MKKVKINRRSGKRVLIYVGLVVLVSLIAIGVYFLFFNKPETSFVGGSPSQLEDCKVISNDGGEINIVIFSDKKNAEYYVERFLGTEPFIENEDKFNFFYIDNYKPVCELYSGFVLLCYSKDLIKKAASCPSDFIVVLEEQPVSIRSSAYMNVMSLNLNHPWTVFLHEFGHVFANFAEEYVDSGASIPKNSKNCQANCEDFISVAKCYEGCTKSVFFRTIKNGVMKTLDSSSYGDFDSNLIRGRISEIENKPKLLTGNAIYQPVDCGSQRYSLLSLDSNGDVSLEINQGCKPGTGYGDNSISVLEDGRESFSGNFNSEFLFTTAVSESGTGDISGETFSVDKEVYLGLPIDYASDIEEGIKVNEIIIKNYEGTEISKFNVKTIKESGDIKTISILNVGEVSVGEATEEDVIINDLTLPDFDVATYKPIGKFKDYKGTITPSFLLDVKPRNIFVDLYRLALWEKNFILGIFD
ncbi:MAG: hypothetical protein ABIF88_03710 [archaeon]